MSTVLSNFKLASDLGPSPSEVDQLRELCSRQAEQIEQMERLLNSPQPQMPEKSSFTPKEKQALITVISDLGHRIENLERLVAKHGREIEWLLGDGKL
ncbi:MAG: hypothetical protein A4E48_00253 [Methanosaeta sp. PtaU1.Bin060]|nr:MAG: hypothetical protein A4E48_00253 [Methanosaeta sp. PtaU1.Bin060]